MPTEVVSNLGFPINNLGGHNPKPVSHQRHYEYAHKPSRARHSALHRKQSQYILPQGQSSVLKREPVEPVNEPLLPPEMPSENTQTPVASAIQQEPTVPVFEADIQPETYVENVQTPVESGMHAYVPVPQIEITTQATQQEPVNMPVLETETPPVTFLQPENLAVNSETSTKEPVVPVYEPVFQPETHEENAHTLVDFGGQQEPVYVPVLETRLPAENTQTSYVPAIQEDPLHTADTRLPVELASRQEPVNLPVLEPYMPAVNAQTPDSSVLQQEPFETIYEPVLQPANVQTPVEFVLKQEPVNAPILETVTAPVPALQTENLAVNSETSAKEQEPVVPVNEPVFQPETHEENAHTLVDFGGQQEPVYVPVLETRLPAENAQASVVSTIQQDSPMPANEAVSQPDSGAPVTETAKLSPVFETSNENGQTSVVSSLLQESLEPVHFPVLQTETPTESIQTPVASIKDLGMILYILAVKCFKLNFS